MTFELEKQDVLLLASFTVQALSHPSRYFPLLTAVEEFVRIHRPGPMSGNADSNPGPPHTFLILRSPFSELSYPLVRNAMSILFLNMASQYRTLSCVSAF